MTATDDDLAGHLLPLEVALARRDLAALPGGLEDILDPAFVEHGSSGRVWSREETIAMLKAAPAPSELTVEAFAVERLADDVALVTYRLLGRATHGDLRRSSIRSSVWVLRDGAWRIRFHQGTSSGA